MQQRGRSSPHIVNQHNNNVNLNMPKGYKPQDKMKDLMTVNTSTLQKQSAKRNNQYLEKNYFSEGMMNRPQSSAAQQLSTVSPINQQANKGGKTS